MQPELILVCIYWIYSSVLQDTGNSRQRRSIECCKGEDYCNRNLHPTLPPPKPPRKFMHPPSSACSSFLPMKHEEVLKMPLVLLSIRTRDRSNNCQRWCYTTQDSKIRMSWHCQRVIEGSSVGRRRQRVTVKQSCSSPSVKRGQRPLLRTTLYSVCVCGGVFCVFEGQ